MPPKKPHLLSKEAFEEYISSLDEQSTADFSSGKYVPRDAGRKRLAPLMSPQVNSTNWVERTGGSFVSPINPLINRESTKRKKAMGTRVPTPQAAAAHGAPRPSTQHASRNDDIFRVLCCDEANKFSALTDERNIFSLAAEKMRYRMWTEKFSNAHNDGMTSKAWIPVLVDELNKTVPPREFEPQFYTDSDLSLDGAVDGHGNPVPNRKNKNSMGAGGGTLNGMPLPSRLRTSVALFIVQRVLDTAGIPRCVLHDLLSACYAGRPDVEEEFIDRIPLFQQCYEAEVSRSQSDSQMRTAEKISDRAKRQLEETAAWAVISSKRMHFFAWRSVIRQGAWRTCARHWQDSVENMRLKGRMFRGWCVFVQDARAVGERLRLQKQLSEEQQNSTKALAKLASEKLRTGPLQLDVLLGVKKPKSDEEAITPKAGGHDRRNPFEMDDLEREHKELESLRRRVGEMESRISQLKVEKEKTALNLHVATDSLQTCVKGLMGDEIRSGMKAADLISNTEYFEKGEFNKFIATDSPSDSVGFPIYLAAENILCVWGTHMLDQHRELFHAHSHSIAQGAGGASQAVAGQAPVGGAGHQPKYRMITNLTKELSDGHHYVTIAEYLWPENTTWINIKESPSAAHRMNKFVSEASALLLRRVSPPPGALNIVRVPPTATEAEIERHDAGPIIRMGVKASDLLEGNFHAHMTVMYLLMKYYASTHSPIRNMLHTLAEPGTPEFMDDATFIFQLGLRSRHSWTNLLHHVEDTVMGNFSLAAKHVEQSKAISRYGSDAVIANYLLTEGSLIPLHIPHDEEAEVITSVALHAEALHDVFGHYAGNSKVLSVHQFEKLMVDAVVCGERKGCLPRSAALDVATTSGPLSSGGLAPKHFVVAVVKMAMVFTDSHVEDKGVKVSAINRFEYLLHTHLLSRTHFHVNDNIRRLMGTPSVKSVVSVSFAKPLYTVYCHITGETTKRKGTTMDGGEFQKFLKDIDMFDHHFTRNEAIHVFNAVQDDDDLMGNAELCYSEFVDAMVALALYKIPNPFYSPASRVSYFLTERFFPIITKKFPTLVKKIGTIA